MDNCNVIDFSFCCNDIVIDILIDILMLFFLLILLLSGGCVIVVANVVLCEDHFWKAKGDVLHLLKVICSMLLDYVKLPYNTVVAMYES